MKNNHYIIFAVLFILASLGGVFYLVFLSQANNTAYTGQVPELVLPTATPALEDEIVTTNAPVATPSTTLAPSISPLPTAKITPATTKVPTAKPTLAAVTTSTPASEFATYESTVDSFSVTYSSTRNVYPDTEASGNRYTFFKSGANIAVHVGTSWSWTYPDRVFTTTQTLGGEPTFRYDIKSQTIVDAQKGDKKYTVQCIHNGVDSAKSECEDFLKSFKFL